MKRGGWGGGNEMERQEWVECLSERERMCVCVWGGGGGGAYEGMKESDRESVRKPETGRKRQTDIDRQTDIQTDRQTYRYRLTYKEREQVYLSSIHMTNQHADSQPPFPLNPRLTPHTPGGSGSGWGGGEH